MAFFLDFLVVLLFSFSYEKVRFEKGVDHCRGKLRSQVGNSSDFCVKVLAYEVTAVPGATVHATDIFLVTIED